MDKTRLFAGAFSPVRRPRPVVVLLLGGFAALAFPSAVGDSATFDETAHLPAGISYLQKLDFRQNPEHPPLVKAWAALLPVALGRADPAYLGPAWTGTRVVPGTPYRTGADQWRFGFETLNGPLGHADRHDPARLLVPARAMVIVLGLALGGVVFAWARSLWGTAGGLLSLLVFATSPTMLAHTRLVTTDLGIALAITATAWLAWRWTQRPSWRRAATLGAVFGATLLVKFSALLVPVLVVPAIGFAIVHRRRVGEAVHTPKRVVLAAVGAAIVCGIVLWAGYGFRWSATSDPDYRLDWESIEASAADSLGVRTALVLRDARVVPEAYAFGLGYFSDRTGRRLAYLNGETSIVGWWWYFPEALVLKTPLVTLALVAVALAVLLSSRRRLRRRVVELAFLGIPAAGYFAVSMAANLNLGHRHLTPLYPFLFIGIGGLARVATTSPRRWLLGIASVALAGTALTTAPAFLSYFNLLAGGASGGPRYLVDSNVDWGQDLARLPGALREHGVETVHLAYFGTADPLAYDIAYRKVLMVHDFRPSTPTIDPGPGDVLAISVTLLHGMYVDPDREFATEAVRSGVVGRRDVEHWLRLRDERSLAGEDPPGLAEWLERTGRIESGSRDRIESKLLSTKIRIIREHLVPFETAGRSILLYRVPEGFDAPGHRDRESG
jgi:hypothetical protein